MDPYNRNSGVCVWERESKRERGEDLLHEWDLEGPAPAIGDDALPWQPSVRVGPAARALTVCQPRTTKTEGSFTKKECLCDNKHTITLVSQMLCLGIRHLLLLSSVLVHPFSHSISLSHTQPLRVYVMLFAGSIFLRECLAIVFLSRIKMLTSFSSREYVLLVRVWWCWPWDLEERHGRGRSLSAP